MADEIGRSRRVEREAHLIEFAVDRPEIPSLHLAVAGAPGLDRRLVHCFDAACADRLELSVVDRSEQTDRGLYIVKDMKAGDVLTPQNMGIIRPGYGLAPKYYDPLRGKRVVRTVKRGTAPTWDLIGR